MKDVAGVDLGFPRTILTQLLVFALLMTLLPRETIHRFLLIWHVRTAVCLLLCSMLRGFVRSIAWNVYPVVALYRSKCSTHWCTFSGECNKKLLAIHRNNFAAGKTGMEASLKVSKVSCRGPLIVFKKNSLVKILLSAWQTISTISRDSRKVPRRRWSFSEVGLLCNIISCLLRKPG